MAMGEKRSPKKTEDIHGILMFPNVLQMPCDLVVGIGSAVMFLTAGLFEHDEATLLDLIRLVVSRLASPNIAKGVVEQSGALTVSVDTIVWQITSECRQTHRYDVVSHGPNSSARSWITLVRTASASSSLPWKQRQVPR